MIFAVSIVRFLGSLPGKDTSRGLYVPERVFYIDYKYIYITSLTFIIVMKIYFLINRVVRSLV